MTKALACLYRYGPLVVLIPLMSQHYAVAGILILFFSIWNAYGYKKKWRHIYCAYQSMSHQQMTPCYIDWDNVKKREVIGISVTEAFLGIMMIFICFL